MNDLYGGFLGLHPASVAGALLAGSVDPVPAANDALPEPAPRRARGLRRLAAVLTRRSGDAAAAPAPAPAPEGLAPESL